MPIVNRYTQMPSPIMLNPMTFEELSRVPLAKAQAAAEGAGALNRIQTDYNVDERDLGHVTEWIEAIDKQKTAIVDSMFNQGVTNQVVNDVLKLKRDRDILYKTKINQAEENKKRIDIWKQTVDQLYAKESPEYAELVKQKELKNWQGTFADGDTPKTFEGTYGADYFDLKKDVFEYMSQAREMTELEHKYRTAGAPQEVSIGNYNAVYTPQEYSKQSLSNKYKLLAVADQLREEYKDINTKRGKFKAYVDMSDEELDYTINQAYNAYLQEMTKEQGGGGSYSGMTPKTIPGDIPYFGQEAQLYTYKKLQELDNLSYGNASNIANSWKEAKEEYKKTAGSINSNIDPTGLTRFMISFVSKLSQKTRGSEKDRTTLVRDNFKELAAELEKTGVISKKERLIAQGYKDKSSGLTDKDYEKIQLGVLDKINDHLTKHSNESQQSYIISADQMKTNYGLSTKLDPTKAAEDLTKGALNIYNRDKRDLVTSDKDKKEFEEIRKSLLTGKVQIEGVATMFSPDLMDNKGNFIQGLSSANLITIKDPESPYFGKQYYIKQQAENIKSSLPFKRMEEVNEIVLNTPMGIENKLFIINEKGLPELVTVKHTGITGGDYRVYLTERNDNTGISLNSEEGKYLSSMLIGPKILKELATKR